MVAKGGAGRNGSFPDRTMGRGTNTGPFAVIPAQAGIQCARNRGLLEADALDPRLRGDDESGVWTMGRGQAAAGMSVRRRHLPLLLEQLQHRLVERRDVVGLAA